MLKWAATSTQRNMYSTISIARGLSFWFSLGIVCWTIFLIWQVLFKPLYQHLYSMSTFSTAIMLGLAYLCIVCVNQWNGKNIKTYGWVNMSNWNGRVHVTLCWRCCSFQHLKREKQTTGTRLQDHWINSRPQKIWQFMRNDEIAGLLHKMVTFKQSFPKNRVDYCNNSRTQ
jgi:hypothetical protein